uniref:NADP-dependent oxidoreductase domain-containing protein n=1 Tax=Hucho hucho TaxID=62062 RepID=A0A4W5PAT6_9TELE
MCQDERERSQGLKGYTTIYVVVFHFELKGFKRVLGLRFAIAERAVNVAFCGYQKLLRFWSLYLKNGGTQTIIIDCKQLRVTNTFQQGDAPFPMSEDGTLLYDDIDYKLTWVTMEKLVGKGMNRDIGLSSFNSRQVDDVLSVESHPYLAQMEWLRHCRGRDLVMTVFSPLGSPDWAWKHLDEPIPLDEPAINTMAKKYKSPAQIIIRWQTQQGVVTIPKSVRKFRIREYPEIKIKSINQLYFMKPFLHQQLSKCNRLTDTQLKSRKSLQCRCRSTVARKN